MNENTPTQIEDTPPGTDTMNLVLPSEPAPGETLECFEAFVCYFDLGKDRSLKRVAEMVGVHETTAKEWSARHGWRKRIHDYKLQMFKARLRGQAAAAREQALGKSERDGLARQHHLRLSHGMRAAGESLLQNFLLMNPDKARLGEIVRMLVASAQLGKLAVALTPETHAGLDREAASLLAEYEERLNRIYGREESASAPADNTGQSVPSLGPSDGPAILSAVALAEVEAAAAKEGVRGKGALDGSSV